MGELTTVLIRDIPQVLSSYFLSRSPLRQGAVFHLAPGQVPVLEILEFKISIPLESPFLLDIYKIAHQFIQIEEDFLRSLLLNDSLEFVDTEEDIPRVQKFFALLGRNVLVLPSSFKREYIFCKRVLVAYVRDGYDFTVNTSLSATSQVVNIHLWEHIGLCCEIYKTEFWKKLNERRNLLQEVTS